MKDSGWKERRKPAAGGIDWIVLTATALALAVVVAASIGAGERGLAAHLARGVIASDA